MTDATHLGDGAYISTDEYGGLVITANHHSPAMATDSVYLDEGAITALVVFLARQGFLPDMESPQ